MKNHSKSRPNVPVAKGEKLISSIGHTGTFNVVKDDCVRIWVNWCGVNYRSDYLCEAFNWSLKIVDGVAYHATPDEVAILKKEFLDYHKARRQNTKDMVD